MEEEAVQANEEFVEQKKRVKCLHVWEKISGSMAESHYRCLECREEDWH